VSALRELHEPTAPDPAWPRYGRAELPPYRFVPGLNAHPTRDPEGHSFGRVEEPLASWEPASWQDLDRYLEGIDLYNFAYWWECHETLEELWLAAGRTTVHARFIQGIIQIAAANLNRHLGKSAIARGQAEAGVERMLPAGRERRLYMGIDVADFTARVRASFDDASRGPALVRLES
jgi:hypothetical protein